MRDPLGYYRNAALDVRVEQPTPFYGLTAWAGWRIGVGSFPVYDSKLETLARLQELGKDTEARLSSLNALADPGDGRTIFVAGLFAVRRRRTARVAG